MPHVELYIADQLCDLQGDEKIEVDYTIFDITKVESRGGARSYSFELPKTDRNKSVLENPEMVNNLSQVPYTRLKCRCYVDGVDTLIRFCEVSSVKSSYSIRLYGGNSDLFANIKDKKLRELDLSEYDHFWVLSEIVQNTSNADGIIYPIIDYHLDSPNSYINNSNSVVRADFILPSVFVNGLLVKIFGDTEYSFTNEIESDTISLILPYIGDTLIRDRDARKYEATFTVNTPYSTSVNMPPLPSVSVGIWIKFDSVTNADTNYGNYWKHGNFNPFSFGAYTNIFLRFAEKVKFTVEYDLQFVGDGYDNSTEIDFVTDFSAFLSNQLGATWQVVFSPDTTNDWGVSGEFIMETIDVAGWLTDADYSNCLMLFSPRSLTIKAGSYVRIKDVTILQDGLLKYIGSYQQKNYLTVGQILPDMLQSDFLKAYMQMFCLLPVIDEANKRVSLIKFDKLLQNTPNCYDWSNKLDLTEDAEITFIEDNYAQNNNFKYTQDGDEPKPIGTDGVITIRNQNLEKEKEKDIIELIFAGTNSVQRCEGLQVDNIGIFLNGEHKEVRIPRILVADIISNTTNISLTDDISAAVIPADCSIPYFIDASQTFNLGFGNNLLDNYYDLLSQVLSRVKLVKILVRLNVSDISQLDFTRPVFIQKYESYFYISSIKGFSYTESKSTLVELVKINING